MRQKFKECGVDEGQPRRSNTFDAFLSATCSIKVSRNESSASDLMGCAPSASGHDRSRTMSGYHDVTEWLNSLLSNNDPHAILAAYIDIDKSIINEESQSPASVMNLALARQQQLRALIQSTMEKTEQDYSGGVIPQDSSMTEIFSDLGLDRNPAIAAEHEEFIANINRRALNLNLLNILNRRLEAAEESFRKASLSIGSLQSLYEKQDMLLGHVYGESYGSEKEKFLEEEIDTMKNYRDAFSGGVFQWQDSESIVRESAELLSRGVTSWRSVESQMSMPEKISMVTEARDKIQEAVVLVELSQNSMPGVQFPYCTKRELTSVSQAIEYVFTDMFIEDRYRHAHQVYKNFQERANALRHWLNEVLNTSLRRDLTDIDQNIVTVSRNLRNERINSLSERLGIENRYNLFGLNPAVNRIRPAEKPRENWKDFDIKRKDIGGPLGFHALGRMFDGPGDFERNIAARRDTLWPSRRIEELMSLNNGQAL